MAFKMNKPVVHGSKEHSALLAKAERIPTHGADPAIMAAVADYGKSNSPDVIDWQIKMAEIEIEKPEPPKDPNKKVSDAAADAARANQKLIDARLEQKKFDELTTETEEEKTIEDFKSEEFSGSTGDPYSYRTTKDGFEFKEPFGTDTRVKGEWYPATGGLDTIKGFYKKSKK
mgnify:CR=1 FL=1|jgi:hypothetical protein|tara:strand:- start:218 stop:736 length:519 start_codon:yes stop_codon:yes gene_type:complete